MNREELARKIYDISNIRGRFLLRSGIYSDEYFDKYLFEGDPLLLRAIGKALLPMVPRGIDALAGLEMGGIPIATCMSLESGLPTRFVRKAAKEYGTCRLAEGGVIDGMRLLIVEDVVTSGGQVVESCRELRALGARVEDVVCVIDREGGGTRNLASEGLTLHPLFTMSQLKMAAVK